MCRKWGSETPPSVEGGGAVVSWWCDFRARGAGLALAATLGGCGAAAGSGSTVGSAATAAERMALKMSSSKVATGGGVPRGTAGVGEGGAMGVRLARAADWMADRMSAGGGIGEFRDRHV